MIRVRLLGHLALTDPQGREIPGVLSQPKIVGILTFLACVPPADFIRRATLLPLFWPESGEASARHALSQALYRLRHAIGAEVIETRGAEDIRLAIGQVDSDITALNAAIAEGRWSDAVTLYAGELLPGFALVEAGGFERWLEDERASLQRRAATAAWSAAAAALSAGQTKAAENAARRGLELDPLNESALQRIMAGLIAEGDVAGAMSLFEDLGTRLRRDYDVQPAAATEAVLRNIFAARNAAPNRVAVQPQDAGARAPSSSRSSPPGGSMPDRTRRTAVAVFALLGLGVIALVGRSRFLTPQGAVTVAVLPLVERSDSPADVYVAEGLHSALIGELAQSADLQVLPRASLRSIEGTGRKRAPAELDIPADAIVTTELLQDGDSVHLYVELLRGKPASVLWTGRYDRHRREVPALPVEVATAIFRELRMRVTSRYNQRLEAARALNPAAYDAWLRAEYHASRRRRDDLRACVENAARALAMAPAFAEAQLLAAHCNNVLAFVDTIAPDSAFGRAERAARLAIALDPGLAPAYAELAYAVAHHDWDWQQADSLYRVALGIDDRRPEVHADYAWFLATLSRFDEALSHARRSELLAPRSPQAIQRTAMILSLAGRQNAAVEKAQQAIAADSTFMFAWDRLHWAYYSLNRPAEALRAAQRASELAGPADARRQGFLAHAYAHAGDTVKALAVLNELVALHRRVYVPPSAIAAVLVGLGDLDGAIDQLEIAQAGRDGDMVLLNTFALWDPLRGSPRFEAIVRRMKFIR